MNKKLLFTLFALAMCFIASKMVSAKEYNLSNPVIEQHSYYAPQVAAIGDKVDNCYSVLGNPNTKGTPAYYLSFAFKVMRVIAIGILVVMSVFDFISAITKQEDKAVMTALKKSGIRLVLCLVFFFLPFLIDLGFKWADLRSDGCRTSQVVGQ